MNIDDVVDDLSKRADTVGSEFRDFVWLLKTLALGAVIGAVYTELRKPPQRRTWHGKLLGVVPYDLRIPKLNDLRLAYWNPRSQKIFTERPLGVGWAINVPTLLRRLGVTGTGRRRTAAKGTGR
ncbi:MAG: hypothetical protein ACXWWL_06800 [Candidatus Limnocylindria bacterium]